MQIPNSSTLSGGAIAGIVIGCIAGTGLVVALWLYLRKSKTVGKHHARQYSAASENAGISLTEDKDDYRVAEAGGYSPIAEAPHTSTRYEMQVLASELQDKSAEPKELPA
jgi:hypothetical protein